MSLPRCRRATAKKQEVETERAESTATSATNEAGAAPETGTENGTEKRRGTKTKKEAATIVTEEDPGPALETGKAINTKMTGDSHNTTHWR